MFKIEFFFFFLELEDSSSYYLISKVLSNEEIENVFYCIVKKIVVLFSDVVEGSLKVVIKYMCRFCVRQFESVEDMKQYIVSYNRFGRVLKYVCYVCGKIYFILFKFQRYVRVYSGERFYFCNVCGRRFIRLDYVK